MLLVTPEGGKLVRTPSYSPDNNRQQRSISVILAADGSASANIRTNYTGLQQEPYRSVLHSLTNDQQREWLTKHLNLPSFDLHAFSFAEKRARIPAVTETMTLSTRRWTSPSGSRLFLPLNLISPTSAAPVLTKSRRLPLVMTAAYDYEDTDTVTYVLPDGYSPEFLVQPQVIEAKFGSYSANVTVSGKQLVYTRRLRMHRGNYPAEAYTEYADFRKKVAKADRGQLVLIKKELATATPK
ncbi:MAG: hypothetical protein EOO39_20205 [Cytophagaceae bacterium]|nr:MAG: hypothetical protein EOO39_20205 [Cytophagaceae bacterium]